MQTVFLDLDGTLIDSQPGITASIQHALREIGAEVPEAGDLTWGIGASLWHVFEVLLGPGADIDEAVALYRERFTTEGLYEADIYDGVGEMLEDLRATGAAVHIATSKPHVYAQTIADHFGLSAWIDGLYGAELDGTRSDKGELLAHALAETEADPARSVMIGDRHHDINGAKLNGLASVGALWGYGEEGELHLAEADALASHPEEVAEVLADMFGLEE